MSYQSINRGTVPNDNTGDTLRDGAEKINLNFKEIYDSLGDGNNITFNVSTFTTETQTFENKTINAANNTINISVEELSNVRAPIPAEEGQILQYSGTLDAWTIVDTSVSGYVLTDLIPQTDDSFDLGIPNSKFKNLYLSGNTIAVGNSTITVNNNVFEFGSSIKLGNGVDSVIVDANVIPVHDSTYNLGSPTHKFNSLYLSNNTIYLGDSSISVGPNGIEFVEQAIPQLVGTIDGMLYLNANNEVVINDYTKEFFNQDPTSAQMSILVLEGLTIGGNAQPVNVTPYLNQYASLANNAVQFAPRYSLKLEIHSFSTLNNSTVGPIEVYDLLEENKDFYWNDVDNVGYDGWTLDFNLAKNGFILDGNGNILIVETNNGLLFSDYKGILKNKLIGLEQPSYWDNNLYGAVYYLKLYDLDPVKSVPKPIKPVETPAAISSGSAPTSNTANGVAGDMIVDSGYLYVCHTDNMWVRLPVETSW